MLSMYIEKQWIHHKGNGQRFGPQGSQTMVCEVQVIWPQVAQEIRDRNNIDQFACFQV